MVEDHAGRAGDDQLGNGFGFASGEDMARAQHIGAPVIGQAAPYAGFGGDMADCIAAGHGTAHSMWVFEGALELFDAQLMELGVVASGKVTDPVAVFYQQRGDRSAQKTTGPGDENRLAHRITRL